MTDPSLTRHRKPRRRSAKPTDPTGAGTTARIVVARTPDGEVFHLAATQPIRIGYVTCARGEALCGTPRRLRLPGFLFPPEVTCWMCALIAERDRIITATEGVAA